MRASTHTLDWANQPRPYKTYPDLDPLPLPVELPRSSVPSLKALRSGAEALPSAPLDLPTLAALLHYTNGITKQLRYPGGVMDFRAAACTGALYHIDFYIVIGPMGPLAAGVYHFDPHDNALRQLRAGDFRGELVTATSEEATIAHADAILVATSTFWRNAWKYEERTYRHCFWDLGTCLANLLAMASAHDIPAKIVLGFADDEVNSLIGTDSTREVALALVPLGRSARAQSADRRKLEPLHHIVAPYSATEVDYPAIRTMHEGSSLSAGEVAGWRERVGTAPDATRADGTEQRIRLDDLETVELPMTPIEDVIAKRGSSRQFALDPIGAGELRLLMDVAGAGISADFLEGRGLELVKPYLLANAMDSLPTGSYALRAEDRAIVPLRQGETRQLAARLALGQGLAGDAALNVYFLTDFSEVLERFGNRGYRAAQLEAAITAGRLYLASYALGIGASGLTFFDDDVTQLFSPAAAGQSVMFLIAIGRPVRRRPAQA